MHTPPRIGIIGMGGFAGAHHECILKLEATQQARLVATCDPRAATFTEERPDWNLSGRGVQVFTDYREMLAACGRDLDILVIPTPVPLHAEMHRAGVEAGLGIYLEKPPTLDYLELEQMIACDRAAAKATLVGFNFIVEETRQSLKTRLLAGEFGALREARLLAEWARPASYFQRAGWAGRLHGSDGRVILDSCFGNAMAHYVHNLLFWAGDGGLHDWAQLASVQAELYRAHAIEGADTFFVEAKTPAGAVLRFALTHACRGINSQTETLVCENATIHYLVDDRAEVRWNDGRIETFPLPPRNFVTVNHLAYQRYLRGETSRPETTLADSRPFVALNNLAYVSSRQITPLPASAVTVVKDDASKTVHFTVAGLAEAMRDFLAGGRWPGSTRGWRETQARVVGPADLAEFHATVRAIAEASSRGAEVPGLAD